MKVSKPILITLIVAVLFSAYLIFFTGRKGLPPAPLPKTNILGTAGQMPGLMDTQPSQHPSLQSEGAKSWPDMRNVQWDRDPFLMPKTGGERRIEEPKALFKLVAILESKKGKIAIIGNDIVRKGDFIGDEMVQEVEGDRVILIRKGQKRVLPVSKATHEPLTKERPMEEKK